MAQNTSTWLIGFSAGVILSVAPTRPLASHQADGTYRNPVIHADYSDPDAVRVGRDYFMVSSSFSAVPGLPILHSRDLVNWRLVNHALPRLVPASVFATPQHGNGVWAPAIRHHAGRFWIYYPDPDHGLYVTTASDPRGRWSTPVLVKAGKGLIDPCPLWDDDGRAYLIHAWARSRAGFNNVLTLHRLTNDSLRVQDEGHVVIDGNKLPGYTTLEGPKLYKRGGWYYVFAPAGGVKQGWQSVFRSRAIDGPYEGRIVLAQGRADGDGVINGPHQGALVDTPAGASWFLHFQDLDAYGRIVHLQPVTWRDGWPVIGRDEDGDGTGEPVRSWRKPDVGRVKPVNALPGSDEFNDARLGLQWQWQANPVDGWASLTAPRGSLRLASIPEPAPNNLWHAANLLLQKFPALSFEATAALTLSAVSVSVSDGERAGLIVFGTDYATLTMRKTAGGFRIATTVAREANTTGSREQSLGSADVPVSSAGVPAGGTARSAGVPAGDTAPDAPRVYLRVTVREGAVCRFSYGFDGRSFTPIGEAFVAKPGRWVGAKVGLFAAAPHGSTQAGHARVDWFRVTQLDASRR